MYGNSHGRAENDQKTKGFEAKAAAYGAWGGFSGPINNFSMSKKERQQPCKYH